MAGEDPGATLFYLGVQGAPRGLLTARGRAWLVQLALPAAASKRIEVCLAMSDWLERASARRLSEYCAAWRAVSPGVAR